MAKKKKSTSGKRTKTQSGGKQATGGDEDDVSRAPAFEDSMAELEQVVGELESGSLGLSDSIRVYEKGVKLLRQCHGSLDQIQRRIRLLTGVDENGKETTKGFDDGESLVKSESAQQTESESDPNGQDAPDVDESGRLF